MSYQWYVWIPRRWAPNVWGQYLGARYNLGEPRDSKPSWKARLTVWAMFCPQRGRLCWEVRET